MSYSVLSVTKMTAAQLATYTGVEGMIVINTDTDSIHVLDGNLGGGYSLPNEQTVQSYVNTQVTSIMASGGQILPGAATTAGSVVTWDGGAWQEDASFAQTTYVDSEIAALKPSTPSGTGQALQWDGSQFVHVTMTGGGGGSGVVPTVITPAGSVLTWDGSAYQNTTGFALSTDVSSAVSTLKGTASISFDTLGKIETAVLANTSDISTINTNLISYASKNYVDTEIANLVGSASSAYDTLKEIEDFVVTNSSNIGTVLTNMASKAPIPTLATPTGAVLTWDGSAFQNDPNFAQKPATDSLTDEVLAWDTASGGFVQKDLSGLAPVPTASGSGEFLRWDATANGGLGGFLNQVPATGGGGSSIPTPTTSTDTINKEVLVWDNSLSTLKHETSDFALVNGATTITDMAAAENAINTKANIGAASTMTDLGLVETAVNAKAEAPPTQGTANTYLYHDGSSWQYGTPVSSGSSFGTPAADTVSGEMLGWTNAGGVQNVAATTLGLATETYVDSAISTLLGGASSAYDTLMEIENYITNNADVNMTQLLGDLALKAPIPTAGEVTADGEFLGWDGSAFTKKSVSVQGGAFNLTEVNGEIIFDPNFAVIDAATGVFDFVDNGTEYIIRVKPALAA